MLTRRDFTMIAAGIALALAMLPDDSPPTLINTVPSAMTELLRVRSVPRNVRVVNLGGEALSGQLVDAVYGLPQIKRVWNLYGPTETNVCTFAQIPATIPDDRTMPYPIGLPCSIDGLPSPADGAPRSIDGARRAISRGQV